MASLKGHVVFGILMFPVYFAAFYTLVHLISGSVPNFGVNSMILAYFFFVLGSDLPDVDSKSAPMRWIAHAVFPGISLAVFWNVDHIWKLFEWAKGYSPVLVCAAAVVAGFALGYSLEALKHRGFLHSNVFGLIYALVCYALSRYALQIKGLDLFLITFAGYFGVLTHLTLDYGINALTRWFNLSRGS